MIEIDFNQKGEEINTAACCSCILVVFACVVPILGLYKQVTMVSIGVVWERMGDEERSGWCVSRIELFVGEGV